MTSIQKMKETTFDISTEEVCIERRVAETGLCCTFSVPLYFYLCSEGMFLCVHVGVTANSVHPGIVMTEVLRHYPFMIRLLFNLIGFFFFKVGTLLSLDYTTALCVKLALTLYTVYQIVQLESQG